MDQPHLLYGVNFDEMQENLINLRVAYSVVADWMFSICKRLFYRENLEYLHTSRILKKKFNI